MGIEAVYEIEAARALIADLIAERFFPTGR